MNRLRLPRARASALQLPALALLAASLVTAPLFAQIAADQGTSTTTTTTTTTASTPPPSAVNTGTPEQNSQGGATVHLSPFEVSAGSQQGYYAPNTLAGTRLNTNIGDLPSSISVVTKEQLEDTNSLNLNDVFRYESNTEGASSYTPIILVRGSASDTLGGGGGTSGSYNSAATSGNRIRGLAAADNEVDNFFSVSRLPFDSYNADSVEIDRGPNSIIFGTGSPAGIVNESRTQAVLNQTKGDVALQVSSWGGFRQTFEYNFPLIQDKLAIYVAQLYNSQGFEQKPSADITRRQYASITFVPFKTGKTKITASFENYNNYANDPNGITPIDVVTPWLASGRPVFNGQNDMVTYLSSGRTTGPYVISSTYPNYVPTLGTFVGNAALTSSTSPLFVPGMTFFSAGHTIEFIDQGNVENIFRGQQTGIGTNFDPTAFPIASQAIIAENRLTESAGLPTPALYATYGLPTIVSKQIYDWSTINIDSVDNTYTKAKTYNVGLQQELLPNLNLDLGWFRQELQQTQDAPLSQSSATTMFVDTNATLPTGAPNPHVGQPFIDAYQADVYVEPEKDNNDRATLEYELDFRKWDSGNSPILNFLGHHRFMGVYTQHDDVQTNLRYRPAIYAGDPNYLPSAASFNAATGYSYSGSNNAVEQVLYLGGQTSAANGYAASSAGYFNRPGYGGPIANTVQTFNYTTNAWQSTTIDINSLLFATGGLSENLQDSKTYFWQSYFWNDRIVGTIGINDDQVKNRNTIFPSVNPTAVEFTNGFANTKYWYNEGPWSYVGGNTSSTGVVVKPFQHWGAIDGAANGGNWLAGIARTIGLTFNKANNFNPPTANYTDFFGNPLGKPQGTEKDYGFELATPDNKFFLRATWFKTDDLNQVTSFTSTGRANYIDATLLKDWATTVVEIRNGQSPADPNFGNASVYPITLAEQGQISALTQLPYTYGGNVGAQGEYVNPTGTEDGVAKGVDLEVTYNPLPNWTMKLTGGKQQTTVTNASREAQAWLAYRMPIWLTYTAPDQATVYTKSNGTPLYVGNFWNGYGYDSNVSAASTANATTTQNYYNSVVGSALAVDVANDGGLAPNQREYTASYLTSYTIDRGPLKNLAFGGDVRYTGQATAGYYGSTANETFNTTLQAYQIAAPNIAKPIYTPAQTHVDLFVSYRFKLPWANGRVRAKVQFNVADVTSNGYLLPVTYNFDGTPEAERIIPPRAFSLSTKFSF
jgi:outer membrane receptor protein involved in Fe transport